MTGPYSSQAITDYKKSIAHNAIKMVFDVKGGWDGDAASGFNHHAMWPYPSLSGNTLPPVNGPTGVVQFFVQGAAMNAHGQWDRNPGATVESDGFPPGSTIVAEKEVDGWPGYIVQCDPWTSCYQPWIERIEAALEGWDSVPDPDRFAAEATKAADALQELTPTNGFSTTSAGTWRPTFADPNRSTAFSMLDEYVGADIDSNMIYAFRDKYGPDRIKTVMQNQGQIPLGLTLVLGGEKKLWETAREDIMGVCEAAKNAFNHQPPDFDFSIDLKVVKAFVDLVGVFVPPQAKVAVSAVSAGLGFLQAVIPENKAETTPPAPLSGATPEEVAGKFEEALKTLRRAAFAQEEELYHCADSLLEGMRSVPRDYLHIHPNAGLDSGITTTERINVNPAALQGVGTKHIPIIAAIFGRAAEDVYGLAPESIWTRGWPLGYGTQGPAKQVNEIGLEFDELSTGTGRELVEAGQKLATAAGWLGDKDETAEAAMSGIEDDLDRGKTEWDGVKPKDEPGPPGGI